MCDAARDGQQIVASVKRTENCLNGNDWQGKGPVLAKLVKAFHELRLDLEEHINLETNVLFPVVREVLRGNQQAMERLLAVGNSDQAGPPVDGSVYASASDRWLDAVMEEMGYRDRPHACRALKCVLHALRDRLSVVKAIALGTQLPRALRVHYYEDWPHRWERARHAQKEDFLWEIAESLKDEANTDPEMTARNVFRVVAKQIPADELEGVKNALPGDIRLLWPSDGAPPAMAELIVANQETG